MVTAVMLGTRTMTGHQWGKKILPSSKPEVCVVCLSEGNTEALLGKGI